LNNGKILKIFKELNQCTNLKKQRRNRGEKKMYKKRMKDRGENEKNVERGDNQQAYLQQMVC
jgi:hypothetical protein